MLRSPLDVVRFANICVEELPEFIQMLPDGPALELSEAPVPDGILAQPACTGIPARPANDLVSAVLATQRTLRRRLQCGPRLRGRIHERNVRSHQMNLPSQMTRSGRRTTLDPDGIRSRLLRSDPILDPPSKRRFEAPGSEGAKPGRIATNHVGARRRLR